MTARLLLCLASCLTCAIAHAEDSVSIEQEPQHRLKFANEHVRIFDVDLPAGYQTLMHWHRNDGVFVNIASAKTTAQDLGGPVQDRPGRAIGETYFIGYTAKPKAHRVTNIDSTAYRVADVEIVKSCGASNSFPEDAHQTLIVDNDRVQVTRIVLHPGESTLLQAPCGVLVSVSGGKIHFGQDEDSIEPGEFRWRQSLNPARITNLGDRVFHGVDVRMK